MVARTMPNPTRAGGLFAKVLADALAAPTAQRILGDAEIVCATCRGAGYVRKGAVGPLSPAMAGQVSLGARSSSFETVTAPCPSCRSARPRDRQLATASVLPAKTFDAWKAECAPEMATALIACRDIVAGERAIAFLRGGPGRGKSHLANATAVAWIDAGRGGALFVLVADLLDLLRETQREDASATLGDVLSAYRSVPLLVLDDLGAERPTAWALEQIFKLVDHRTTRQLPLVVTSNIRPSEENDRIEDRVLSRLGPGEVVIAGGADRRREFGA